MIDWRLLCTSFLFVTLFVIGTPVPYAQKDVRLPKAEKIINDYLKAAGGRKRLAAVKDTIYQWNFKSNQSNEQKRGAQVRLLRPAAWRFDSQLQSFDGSSPESISFATAETKATNGSSVWKRQSDGKLQTLTDAQGNAFRLQASLAATRLTDLKTQRIAARTIGAAHVADEPVYIVEFTLRNGAAVQYFFGQKTKLPLKINNQTLETSVCFGDYRSVDAIFEAYQMIDMCEAGGESARVYQLQKITHNANLKIAEFDAPRGLENFDVASFLNDLTQNQEEIERRVAEYTFTETRTEREFDDQGAVKKETVKVYEVFPVLGQSESVSKLISENGVPLSPDRAAKELRRVTKELEDAERKNEKKKAKPDESEKDAVETRNGISSFLRASETIAPRREEFRGRDTIVFDFRPRPGFKPQTRQETIFSKLVGTAWVDPIEKRIIRVEMRFPEGFSAFGGLAKLRSGSAFLFEQTRMPDGVWLPRLAQVNLSAKAFFLAGFNVNYQSEFSNYVKFDSKTKEYQLDKPKEVVNPQ